MIEPISKYAGVRQAVQVGTAGPAVRLSGLPAAPRVASPQVIVPAVQRAQQAGGFMAWLERELKEGGQLAQYLAREKQTMQRRIRTVARSMQTFEQNKKSDFKRLAAVPGRLYQRWKAEDQHFFEDDNNLRSLKRDNPDLPIYVGQRQLPKSRAAVTGGKLFPIASSPKPNA